MLTSQGLAPLISPAAERRVGICVGVYVPVGAGFSRRLPRRTTFADCGTRPAKAGAYGDVHAAPRRAGAERA
jgi:hypothetical protein